MAVTKWAMAGAVARLAFAVHEGHESEYTEFEEEMAKIAGVKNRSGFWAIPQNALIPVRQLTQRFPHVSTVAGSWEKSPLPEKNWEQVEAELRADGTLNDWVYDFYTDYQKEAISFSSSKEGCHFWHSTGAGKTLSGISAALLTPGPVVIVTRAASRIQYSKEVLRFTRSQVYIIRPASEISGRVTVNGESFRMFRSRHKGQKIQPKRLGEMWQHHIATHGADRPKDLSYYMERSKMEGFRPFVIVGWESLPDNLEVLTSLNPGCVIFDELHRGKSSKRYDVVSLMDLPEDAEEASKLARKDASEAQAKGGFIKQTEDGRKMFLPVRNIASCAAALSRSAKRRVGTTATAISNRVRDLWGQLDTIEPNCWGSATQWQDRYCDRKPGHYGGFDTSGESNREELNERLKGVTHILDYRQTHKHLPAKRRQSFYIAPSDQVQESAGFAKELKEAAKRGPTAVLEVKLAMAASRKRKAVLTLIEDHVSSKQKVICFTARRRDCDELGALVRSTSAVKEFGATVWASHGDDSTERRQEIVDEFMDHPGPCVLVATGHSFGESLNLQDCDALLFVQLPYTPQHLRQWEGRVSRLGQKRPVTVYFCIAENTVDEHIASILIEKLPAVEKIAQDAELAQAAIALSGIDPNKSNEEFVADILASIDDDSDLLGDWDDD